MAITHSVGKKAINHRNDTKIIQILLNMNLDKLTPYAPLTLDGRIGPNTILMIEEFQRRVMKVAQPDGKVDPGGKTLRTLRAGIPADLTQEVMQGVMLGATPQKIALYHSALLRKMESNGIDTPLRRAHFLAQLGHESADLIYAEEIASGAAYEGRADLGNTQPGDGVRFKGRGLIQLTGRANYQAYGDARGANYTTGTNNTLIATDPELAVDAAGWFWSEHDLNRLADADDVLRVTRAINGGTNGLVDRQQRLIRAKFFLGVN